MDLDRISDNERKRRVDNKLCLACGQSGHWKEAHDPNKTANPIPMPSYNNLQQQWRMRLAEPYEPGYVIDEDLSPTTNNSTSRSDLVPLRQDSPAPQSLKGQPLD